jgi:spore maturation protein SpmB
MLIAISLLRTSGVFDVIIDGMKWVANAASLDPRFVDGLPTALIKPLSGSGARGMMVDTMATFGADSSRVNWQPFFREAQIRRFM